MSRTVWKFPLPLKRNELDMPAGAKILTVGSQTIAGKIGPDTVHIWAEVGPDAETERRTFLVYGTGWPLPEDEPQLAYRGTALLYRTSLVFHVYEEVA